MQEVSLPQETQRCLHGWDGPWEGCRLGHTEKAEKLWEEALTSVRTRGLSAHVICDYNQVPVNPLQISTDTSSLRKADPKGRSALLADIQQGTRLRKVTQINDRSAPQIESK